MVVCICLAVQHDHPYISAMINNGTLQYDHDRDGTHSQIAGCSVSLMCAGSIDMYTAHVQCM